MKNKCREVSCVIHPLPPGVATLGVCRCGRGLSIVQKRLLNFVSRFVF